MNEIFIPALPGMIDRMRALMNEAEAEQVDPDSIERMLRVNPLTWCALHDGEPMCIGGVTAQRMAWMISTPELNRQKRFFLRQSGVVMAAIRGLFDEIGVTVDVCYSRSTRWLLWLGFRAMGGAFQFNMTGRSVTVQRFVWRAACD